MDDLIRPEVVFLLLGAPCVGSFLGVLVERLPAGAAMVWSRSACPHCGRRLGLRDLVPFAAWLACRGCCRTCGARLGIFYPAIEALALLLALWALAVVPGPTLWITCLLGWALLALAFIDARYLVLPDVLTLPLIPAGLAVTWWLAPERLVDHGVGVILGYLVMALIAVGYRRWRGREGLGLGDARLLAAAGAWVGWQGLATVVLYAAAAGLVGALLTARLAGVLERDRELPFGPYLSGGLWLVWLYGPLSLG